MPEEEIKQIQDLEMDYNDNEAEEFRKKLAGISGPSARKGDRRAVPVESSENEDNRSPPRFGGKHDDLNKTSDSNSSATKLR